MAAIPDDVPQHAVLRGLAQVRDGLAQVTGASCWGLSDGETRDALAEVTQLQAVARAAYLKLLAESARRDVCGCTGRLGGSDVNETERAETCAWLSGRVRLSTGRVRADLEEARALDPDGGDLRQLGQQLAGGNVTPEHAGVAVRALRQIPLGKRCALRTQIDQTLTGHALEFAPHTTRTLAAHLLDTIEPDRTAHFDLASDQRRELYLVTDSTGMLLVRGQLEPAGGAAFKGLLDHLSAPHRGLAQDQTGQSEITVNDMRSPSQRRHDALIEIVRLAGGNLDAGVRAGEPPRVVVHSSPEQLAAATSRSGTSRSGTSRSGTTAMEPPGPQVPPGSATCEQTGPISPATLGRLACDAVIDRILLDPNGKVLEMATLGRLFTPAQRRALAARDGGCAFPGCDRPPSWCDAHHVLFWSHGGPTTVDNGVLLCGPHHTSIHLGPWTIAMRDGVPWFVPPARLDPGRRALRNTVHDAVASTRRAGQQMHIGLTLAPRGSPPPKPA